jgi:hypothetical protein
VNRRGFTDAGALLHDLLDRLEARPESQRLLAYVNDAGFDSVRHESECLTRLEAAERAGGIAISRARTDDIDRIRHVALMDAGALYEHLRRVPSGMQVETALGELTLRASAETAVVLREVSDSWRRKVSRFGIAPGDVKSLDAAIALADALRQRAAESSLGEVDYRTFSRSMTNDSKALERLKGPALAILRRTHPESLPSELDDNDALNSLGIVRLPQPFLVSGPIAVAGVDLGELSYVGVPASETLAITLVRPVRYVLVVENFTSFVRHVRELNAQKSGLIVYGGGFPSRDALRTIVRLAEIARAPTFHWGDLDVGGATIFRHIETALAAVYVDLLPHLMDPALLAEGQPRTTGRRPIAGKMNGSAISQLWDALSFDLAGRVLEQEAVNPRLPI